MQITASRLDELAQEVAQLASNEDSPAYLLELMVKEEELAYDETSVIE